MVFGATGFTGGLVCRALARRGVPFAVAGRRRDAVETLCEELKAKAAVTADPADPGSLGALTAGATRVLVSCAGPFLRCGRPVVEAAVAAGVHYLDTTGEQPFIKAVAEQLDGRAQETDSTVVSGMAMEFAVGDWTAQLAMNRAHMKRFREVAVAYGLRGDGITRGTALSIFEMFGRTSWSWENGRYVRRPVASLQRTFAFPFGGRSCLWMPFGEVVYLARRGNVENARTFMRLPASTGAIARWMGMIGGPVRALLRPAASAWIRSRPAAPTAEQRRSSRFTIVAGADGSRAVAWGADPYGLTAEIIATGAEHLLEHDAARGVRSPATIGLAPKKTLQSVGVIVE